MWNMRLFINDGNLASCSLDHDKDSILAEIGQRIGTGAESVSVHIVRSNAENLENREIGRMVILGNEWKITESAETEDMRLKDCDGYTDWTTKEIVVEREIYGNLGDMNAYVRKVKRHEIIHAFLLESGLAECSDWAQNEEMVDWLARMGPKINAAWQAAGAI